MLGKWFRLGMNYPWKRFQCFPHRIKGKEYNFIGGNADIFTSILQRGLLLKKTFYRLRAKSFL